MGGGCQNCQRLEEAADRSKWEEVKGGFTILMIVLSSSCR